MRIATIRWRALAWALAGLFSGLVVASFLIVGLVLYLLTPSAAEGWRERVGIGGLAREVSMPALLRMATHPLAAPWLDGRSLELAGNHWRIAHQGTRVEALCAPCRLRWAAFGDAPLALQRVRVVAQRGGADQYSGRLILGQGTHEAVISWGTQLHSSRIDWSLRLAPLPMAELVGLFGSDMPEASRIQVQGSFGFSAQGRWPDGVPSVRPELSGLVVGGLGTEQLADLQPPAVCRSGQGGSEAIAGWLPRALVAAEDARFFEHPGYELEHMVAALQFNQQQAQPRRGASTISQQLAKLVITGDDRSATRKLRELLYAVEMERTLGKARILQLYLALAPWGDGVCGAERAARVYLGKPASKLGPVAAAWLVSLLRNPDAQLQALATTRQIDRERLRQIVAGIKPMAAAQRALAQTQLEDWAPTAP